MSLTILEIYCEAVGQNITSEQSDVKPLALEFLCCIHVPGTYTVGNYMHEVSIVTLNF
jgi:hypothetical protein